MGGYVGLLRWDEAFRGDVHFQESKKKTGKIRKNGVGRKSKAKVLGCRL